MAEDTKRNEEIERITKQLIAAARVEGIGQMMSRKEAAQMTGKAEATLATEACRGGDDSLPYFKLGRTVRYSREFTARWLAERFVRSSVGGSIDRTGSAVAATQALSETGS